VRPTGFRARTAVILGVVSQVPAASALAPTTTACRLFVNVTIHIRDNIVVSNNRDGSTVLVVVPVVVAVAAVQVVALFIGHAVVATLVVGVLVVVVVVVVIVAAVVVLVAVVALRAAALVRVYLSLVSHVYVLVTLPLALTLISVLATAIQPLFVVAVIKVATVVVFVAVVVFAAGCYHVAIVVVGVTDVAAGIPGSAPHPQ